MIFPQIKRSKNRIIPETSEGTETEHGWGFIEVWGLRNAAEISGGSSGTRRANQAHQLRRIDGGRAQFGLLRLREAVPLQNRMIIRL